MAVVEQYGTNARPSPFAGTWRFFSFRTIAPILSAPKYLFRRTDAEIQQRRIKIAERISANAALPTTAPIAEPARLSAATMIARLQPHESDTQAAVEEAAVSTVEVSARLDRVEYELAAIRRDLAPLLSVEPKRPCAMKNACSHDYRM